MTPAPGPTAPSAPEPRRRRQGDLFITLGVAHCLLMIFASLYTFGLLPWFSINVQQWNKLYFGFFICLYAGSASLIIREALRSDVFIPQAILDALVGLLLFQLLFWAVRRILAHGKLTPWISLLPGLFLIYYGFELRRGRALWKRLELD